MGKFKIEYDLTKALDIGCGPQKLEGAIGIDHDDLPDIDISHNLNRYPWPVKADTFTFIRAQHIIEHITDLQGFVKEMHRVAKNEALIEITTPHYSNYTSFRDPTHIWHFSLESTPQLYHYAFKGKGYEIMYNELSFSGAIIDFPGWLVYKMSKRRYEKHFAWVFPCVQIKTIVKINK